MTYVPGNPDTLQVRLSSLVRKLCNVLEDATQKADELGGYGGVEPLELNGKEYFITVMLRPAATM